MNQTFANILKTATLTVLLPFSIVSLIYSILSYLYLSGDDLVMPESEKLSYHYNLSLAGKILPSKTAAAPVKQIEATDRIRDIRLKGTYLEDVNSFIVIEDHLGTTFLYKGDRYMGYVLREIYSNRAVFEKNARHYDLVIDEGSDKHSTGTPDPGPQHSGAAQTAPDAESFEPVTVSRDTIDTYIKEPNKIWRNIRIQEIRKNGQITGFRVNYVKKGSFFDKTGLKSGDVIKAIDGSEIHSLADVMKYYNNINNLDGLSLTVQRGNEEVELEFNIN